MYQAICGDPLAISLARCVRKHWKIGSDADRPKLNERFCGFGSNSASLLDTPMLRPHPALPEMRGQ